MVSSGASRLVLREVGPSQGAHTGTEPDRGGGVAHFEVDGLTGSESGGDEQREESAITGRPSGTRAVIGFGDDLGNCSAPTMVT